MKKLTQGSKGPDFTLPGNDGKEHTLSKLRGKWVLLYFYPKDNTPGCTTEAEMFRDMHADFKARKITVFGISTDSVASHEKFAQKLELPFVLLADEDKRVVNAYGVWGKKKFMGREYEGTNRQSFLVDPDGVIAKVYATVKPKEHAAGVCVDFDELAADTKK